MVLFLRSIKSFFCIRYNEIEQPVLGWNTSHVITFDALPPLATDMPHSEIHGSVEEDLISRVLHNNPLFKDENDEVYYDLETALRGTTYLASIKPFQRLKDGGVALLGVQSQYAGLDKCQAELRTQEDIFHNQL